MEIAFLSDIHGNIDGLNAVVKEAKVLVLNILLHLEITLVIITNPMKLLIVF